MAVPRKQRCSFPACNSNVMKATIYAARLRWCQRQEECEISGNLKIMTIITIIAQWECSRIGNMTSMQIIGRTSASGAQSLVPSGACIALANPRPVARIARHSAGLPLGICQCRSPFCLSCLFGGVTRAPSAPSYLRRNQRPLQFLVSVR